LKAKILKIANAAFVLAIVAVGAYAVPKPDLAVQPWTGPAAPVVNTAYQYTAGVRNLGNQTAQGVVMTIEFPLTETSPTRHILGKVTGIPANCVISSNKLVCNLGNIGSNPNSNLRTVTFNFEYPVTTKPLNLVARVTTTSSNEAPTTNNQLQFAPQVAYPDLQVTAADVLVSHCTGQGLTSYFECEKYPSSIQSFTMRLEQGGAITLPYPGYFGNWDQNQGIKQLHFLITDGFESAEFNGFASSTTCFEGITTFTPASPYSSPYKVCLQ
jgi:hypothetical protein